MKKISNKSPIGHVKKGGAYYEEKNDGNGIGGSDDNGSDGRMRRSFHRK